MFRHGSDAVPDRPGSGTAPGIARQPADTGTVARAVAVLRAVAEAGDGTQIKRISTDLRLPASTVHRLLDLLMREGMVERAEATPTYRAGREFLRLSSVVASQHPLQVIAAPLLEQAVASMNETAYLCLYLPRERRLAFAAHVESSHPLGYRVRSHEPQTLLTGASGRSILAFLPPVEREAVLAREGVPGLAELAQDLAAIRARGYALSLGQRIAGAVGIFAPVFAAGGGVTGSLGFTIPEQRFDPSREAEFAREACRLAGELSAGLGFRARQGA
jgi:IclR family acetate operon transcriptional repressor